MGEEFSTVQYVGVRRGCAILSARSRAAVSFVLDILLAVVALDGVQRTARASQRTALGLLNSLQNVTITRINLIQAQTAFICRPANS
jgi:hypothetical protein